MLSSKRRLAKVLTVGMLALGMLVGVTGWATTNYVSPSGNDGNPGTNSGLPKLTIQAAVDAAVDGDTVQVADGTYTLTNQISINNGITVKSASGKATTIVNGGGVARCFYLNHASAVVDGLTITNGYTTGSGNYGAGVSVSGNGGNVLNCTISGNNASGNSGYGGGVNMDTSAGVVSNCVISGNTAKYGGAGVYITGGSLLQNSIIRDNTISSSGGSGGGVMIYNGIVQFCTISGNDGYQGGGVNNSGGSIISCVISNNSSDYTAGAYNNSGTMRNCLIIGNYSSPEWNVQGGIVNNSDVLENCTVVGNAIYSQYSYELSSYHSAVYNNGTMRNCIVINNAPGFYNDGECQYSCTSPYVSGTGNISEDPQFVDYGSGSGTNFVAGDYRLMGHSACINSGNNQGWMSGATDLAGNSRIFNTTVDMGAYEYQAVPPSGNRIAAPVGVSATDGLYGNKVRVTWDAVSGATGYVVYRGTSTNFDLNTFFSATNALYDDTTAQPGTNYYYWVAARDANGGSLPSASDAGYASLYSVNFDGAKVVFIDENYYLKKIDSGNNISNVFNSTNVLVQKMAYNNRGELFLVFQTKVALDGVNSYLVAKATTNNTLNGIDHDIDQLAWTDQSANPNIQVDNDGNAYYFGSQSGQSSSSMRLRKSVNGTTNVVDLINDNISLYNWLVTGDSSVLMSGYTQSTETYWLRRLSSAGNLSNIIAPPVQASFLLEFPDDQVYVGIYSWTYGGNQYYSPGVYRVPPNWAAPQFAFPYIGNSNNCNWSGGEYQRIFYPEYDVNAVMEGHTTNWSSGFYQNNGAYIRQHVLAGNRLYVSAGSWSGAKTIVQYYPTVEIVEPTLIDNVTLFTAFSSNLLVVAGTKDTAEKLILWDPTTGWEYNLLSENVEIYHLQALRDGYVWFDGLKFTGNKYVAGRVVFEVVYGANGKRSVSRPKAGGYTEINLSGKPLDFIGLDPATTTAGAAADVTNAPAAPTELTASEGTYFGKVQLLWRAATGATSYEVYRHTSDSSGLAAKLGDAATVGYDDTTAEVGIIYYYWVKAVNAIGTSGFSASSTGWASQQVNNLAADFDGDGKADPAMVDSDGNWYIWLSSSGYSAVTATFAVTGGSPAAGDFDGDGKADPAMVADKDWYIWFSGSGYAQGGPYVLNGQGTAPVAADFDGDGKADPAMVDSSGMWFIFLSGSGYTFVSANFAISGGGTPVAGDFDGDGKADPAMVVAGSWYIWFSGSGYAQGGPYSLNVLGGSPVAGDLDGDRKADPAMVSSGNWYVWFSGSGYAQGGPYPLSAP